MDFKHLLSLAEVRDLQALAMFDYYYDKVDQETLQNLVDNYCNDMATSFIEDHKDLINNQELNQTFKKYIISIKADKPHSGHRFFEVLYSKMHEPTQETDIKDLSEIWI